MIKLIAFLKHGPDMTQEQFRDRWLEHAQFTTQMPGLRGYYINVATPEQENDQEPLFHGTAELWWDSLEVMQAAFATPEAAVAGADADQFADVRIHLYTTEYTIVPGPHNRDEGN